MNHRFSTFLFAGVFLVLTTMRSQAETDRMSPGLVLVAKVAGTATVTLGGNTSPLKVDDLVPQTALIATGQDSRAVLVFSNGATLQLGANTELVLQEFLQAPFGATIRVADLEEEPSRSQTVLVFKHGELVGNVKRLWQERGSSFQIETVLGGVESGGGTYRIVGNPTSAGPSVVTLGVVGKAVGFVPTAGADPGDRKKLIVQPGQEIRITHTPNADGKVSLEVVTSPIPAETLQRIVTGAAGVAAAFGPNIINPQESDPQPDLNPRTVRPVPRPMLVKTMQARPAIRSENKFGTQNIGPMAYDAKWSNYGAYLQRVIDTVQLQWERIIIEQKANPVAGSLVTVKFVMNDAGRIVDISVVDSSANESATRACVNAITGRKPYGPWTEEMKADLGNRQEMTFSFYYQ